jgi:hypothetical protein
MISRSIFLTSTLQQGRENNIKITSKHLQQLYKQLEFPDKNQKV